MAIPIDDLIEVANAISRGEVPEFQHNECFTSGAFDLLLVKATGSNAFLLLQDAVEKYEAVDEAGVGFRGYFYLLGILARQSETTEVPPGLLEIIVRHPELSHELRNWYRLQN
ncbi:hypothetical protein Pla123a_17680 [Posidoniimonas polymericola]|uniref:Uncharacterized protein n=1 Tax=Posidoniimonas polymericola TaxID=2528002 RepID=A0A5C5YSP1_9BACT|nr:hypothetical protein [Posidoniimonas polymericola]TWT77969.1 hypothetical protein Pla123a_17680 [Posidoniimonas polymericola]